jgi:hypothetical protein
MSQVPVAHACNPSYLGGRGKEDCGSKPVQAIVHETLSRKYPKQKGAGEVAQAIEYLLSKCEALSSNHQ